MVSKNSYKSLWSLLVSKSRMKITILQALVVQRLDSAIHRINLYPVDSASGFPNTYLALVVQTLDSAIQRVNHYPADNAIILFPVIRIRWIVIYPVDSTIQRLNNQGQMIKICLEQTWALQKK